MQYPVNIKFAVVTLLLLFFILFILRTSNSSLSSSSSSSSSHLTRTQLKVPDCKPIKETGRNLITTLPSTECNKIPPSLSETLIHYATSNITPQQTSQEISVSNQVLQRKSPCNFLVFGLGYDSPLWASLNFNGRTVFLEEDASWIKSINSKFSNLDSYHVKYDTKVTQSDELLAAALADEECTKVVDPRESKCVLAHKGLPKEIYEIEWDLIMVDAPTGWNDDAPGRMTAVYTAGLLARNRESGETDVFVHDIDRKIEDKFSKAFLCEGYLSEQVGRIRRFTIPSHMTRVARPFCP